MKRSASAKRLPANVPGKYFTTEDCDGCAYCASVAPEHFDYEKDINRYFVCRQPCSPVEEENLLEAQEDCPLDAIRAEEEFAPIARGGR